MEQAIVFGCGRYYQSKKTELANRYDIIGFADNAVKPGILQTFEGKNMVNPEEINSLGTENPILLMSSDFFTMWEQLDRLGINPRRIRFMALVPPYYDEIEEILSESVEEICAGNSVIILKGKQEEKWISTRENFETYLRALFYQKNPFIQMMVNMPNKPISRRFGRERGKPIDRVYIERFLEENREKISGTVMEVADSGYTEMFGNHVEQSLVLHLNGWGKGVIKGNLETGKGIAENYIDCFICTQTIQFIYDIHSAVHSIYKMLKPGGVVLATAHCLGQISLYDYHNWGEYWRFTDQSMRKLFAEIFEDKNITVQLWGNMKTSIACQYGLCAEDMLEKDFEFQDVQYPVIVTVLAMK